MKKKIQHQEDIDVSEIINTRCPITGNDIDPGELTSNCVRTHEGQLIGFCCPDCVLEWDELSQDEKNDRLSDIMEEE